MWVSAGTADADDVKNPSMREGERGYGGCQGERETSHVAQPPRADQMPNSLWVSVVAYTGLAVTTSHLSQVEHRQQAHFGALWAATPQKHLHPVLVPARTPSLCPTSRSGNPSSTLRHGRCGQHDTGVQQDRAGSAGT